MASMRELKPENLYAVVDMGRYESYRHNKHEAQANEHQQRH
jgi:hypothetical protein